MLRLTKVQWFFYSTSILINPFNEQIFFWESHSLVVEVRHLNPFRSKPLIKLQMPNSNFHTHKYLQWNEKKGLKNKNIFFRFPFLAAWEISAHWS